MCKYCESQEKIKNKALEISIETNKLIMNYSVDINSFYDKHILIRYCPFCGKKL